MLSGTSLITIIYIAGLSHLLTQHLSTVRLSVQCWCCTLQGGEDGSCRSISSQLCIALGDQGVPECTAQQWVVEGKRNSGASYYQTDSSGGHA